MIWYLIRALKSSSIYNFPDAFSFQNFHFQVPDIVVVSSCRYFFVFSSAADAAADDAPVRLTSWKRSRRGEKILSPTKHLVEPFICGVFVWLWDEGAGILYPEGEGVSIILVRDERKEMKRKKNIPPQSPPSPPSNPPPQANTTSSS